MQLPDLKAAGERAAKFVSAIRSAATEFRAGVGQVPAVSDVAPPAPPVDVEPKKYDPAKGPLRQEAFDQIANWMTGQGMVGDPALATQYLYAATIDWQTITNICRASWLARKIVWKKPKDMLRAGYNLIWEGSGDKKKGETNTQADAVRYAIAQKWDADNKIIQALAWARQYGGAIIVIGIKGQDLTQPLPIKDGKVDYSGIKKNGLQSLMVWDRWRANHDGAIDSDPNSPNRGKPLFHVLSSDGATGGQRVHWTRVLRFDGDVVDWWTWRANACWHDSVLQVLIDPLKQYDSTTGAITSLVPKSLRDIIFAKNAAKMAATAEGEGLLAKRYAATARIASMWNVSVYDLENEKHEQRTFNFAGLDKIWEKSMREVGGGAGYPVSVLFDEQPEGLNANGGSSKKNYHDEVEAERKTALAPQHLALLECITRNELGTLPPGFAVEYNSLDTPSPTEQAQINKTNAEADHIRIDDGVITPGLAAREAKERSVYRTMSQEDVDLAELALPAPSDEDPEVPPPEKGQEDKGEPEKDPEAPTDDPKEEAAA